MNTQKQIIPLAGFSLLSLFLLLLLVSGCVQRRPSDASPPPPQAVEFPDIPIPLGMKRVGDKTWTIEAENFKAGLITYRGRIKKDALINFYRDSMPANGWEFVTYSASGKGGMLNFVKGRRTATIIVDEEFLSTTLEIRAGGVEQPGTPGRLQ
ncbi:MAG: hypothetical protein HY731_11665 [Candidatus Tectomicrobia bacterium]|nr:hypothetical protein [Candidatus Tectomicrobia bacterium]